MAVNDLVVETRALAFSYGRQQLLRSVDLAIPRGRVVAILGASGSGKTTLLQLMAGMLKPTAGSVRVFGEEVPKLGTEELYALRRRMGMMFQKGGLFSDLSVFENVAFPVREHTKLPEEVIHDLALMKLHAVGLRGAQALMPAELSGGMSRRVALARAIVLDPALVIYDEPFAGLDPITLNVVGRLIRTLNDALGATSVVVTYDVKEALAVADYAYVISDGTVIGKGTPDEIKNSPSAYLKQFVNALPDGPVRFHFPGPALEDDLRLNSRDRS